MSLRSCIIYIFDISDRQSIFSPASVSKFLFADLIAGMAIVIVLLVALVCLIQNTGGLIVRRVKER
jgi:hypothetical protein